MNDNPYAAPASTANDFDPFSESLHDGFPVATQGKRFANFLIDYFLIQGASFVIGVFVGFVFIAANDGDLTPVAANNMQMISMGIGMLFWFFYYFLPEALFGFTLGKLITGTRVVREQGGRPGALQIAGRTLVRMIPFEPFSFLFGDTTTGWHDTLSRTRVVDVRAVAKRPIRVAASQPDRQ